jgi:hypothetical protein
MELSRGAWARADEATGGGGSGSSSPESSPSQLRPKRHQHIARIGSSSDCSDADAIPVARGAAAVASSSDDDSSSPPLSTTSSMVLTPASAAAVADAAEHECGGRPLQQQHREAQEAAALEDAPFEELCQGGWAWTARNWPIKLLRIFLTPIKLFYLFFVARSLPTNHLMVRSRARRGRRVFESCCLARITLRAPHTAHTPGARAPCSHTVCLACPVPPCTRACHLPPPCRKRHTRATRHSSRSAR